MSRRNSISIAIVCCFIVLLSASDDFIKSDFTVTQIALDLQKDQLDEDEIIEDENASAPNQTQGGVTTKECLRLLSVFF